ncbi:uncharacterized protein PAC_15366 [Phialocephala subalpina]|uniref:Uncharacterized protein n=1 Tax=Phialocephala subalpina TaxID=576137 RepID=A0A1L7XKK6_9HELO|nr:uncharacterized protein PAC_15366 [Phialocephala subalpina]
MRLLNTSILMLQEFIGEDIPQYAILSHRWEEEEVTFQDFQEVQNSKGDAKKGWSKIEGCRAQGAKDGYQWVWIDSCCIDKSSSAELTEAINSMFNWYRKAQVCYTYLSDVPSTTDWEEKHRQDSNFRRSKWFTRGWTLQELLAPEDLKFFTDDWVTIGTKDSLQPLLSEITGIFDFKKFGQASIAQKMSWASKRETTRIEDRAYSLMGLFGVNMPPLYGEGEKAFLRLQLEIMRSSDDESLFAWKDSQGSNGGLLARSPTAFQHSGNVFRLDYDYDTPAYSMTNKGLRIEARLLTSDDPESLMETVDDTFFLGLQCVRKYEGSGRASRLAVRLRRIKGDQFSRITPGELIILDPGQQKALENRPHLKTRETVFHIKQREDSDQTFVGPFTFLIPTEPLLEKGFSVSQRYLSNRIRSQWVEDLPGWEKLITDKLTNAGVTAALMFSRNRGDRRTGLGLKWETSDSFVLIVDIYEGYRTVGINVLKDQLSLKKFMGSFERILNGPWSMRQILLRSGQRITVDSVKSTEEAQGQSYTIYLSFAE